jgi:phosphohistidine phosphatase
MKLIIIRHADREFMPGIPDYNQPLTKKGLKSCEKLGNALQEKDVQWEALYTSPYMRTVQTASNLLPFLTPLKAYTVASELALDPPESSFALENLLYGCAGKNCVGFVGHKPGLEQLIADLSGLRLDLKKAQALCLEVPESLINSKLLWQIDPKGDRAE